MSHSHETVALPSEDGVFVAREVWDECFACAVTFTRFNGAWRDERPNCGPLVRLVPATSADELRARIEKALDYIDGDTRRTAFIKYPMTAIDLLQILKGKNPGGNK